MTLTQRPVTIAFHCVWAAVASACTVTLMVTIIEQGYGYYRQEWPGYGGILTVENIASSILRGGAFQL